MTRRRPAAVSALLAVAAVSTILLVSASSGRDASASACGVGGREEVRDGAVLCVHTDDRPPPGVSARELPGAEELRGRRLGMARSAADEPVTAAATVAGAGVVESGPGYRVKCIGDGISGPRVQAVYAVATDKPDRSRELLPLIRQYAADADLRLNRSAGVQQQGRRLRLVTSPLPDGSCEVDVRVVRLSPAGDDSFDAQRAEMRAQGLTRTDRKYLVWVDAAVGICGLAEVYPDDRPGPENRNNTGPTYSRTDAPCWGYGETHELLHMLGAVQQSAPNATSMGHCTDDRDVLCYDDGSGSTPTEVCPAEPVQYVDCGANDYFAAAPPAGSYLATRWNVANSAYLEPEGPPPAAPRVTVSAPTSMLAGGTVEARAEVTVPAGRTFTVTWSASRTDCRLSSPTGTSTRLSCPTTAAGGVQLTAAVVDSLGLAASNVASVAMPVPGSGRAAALSLALAPSAVPYGGSVRFSGRLTDPATQTGVFGMPVIAYELVGGTTGFRQVGSGTTGVDGRLVLDVRPPASGSVVLVSSATSTWQSATSPRVPVAVRWVVGATSSAPSLRLGGTLRVGVTSRPARAVPVVLQRVTSAGAQVVARGVLSSSGTTSLSYKPAARGSHVLRVVVPATADHAAGTSGTLTLAVL